VIDYGCGDGSFSKLIDKCYDVALYDISKKAIAIARRNFQGRSVTFYASKKDIPAKHFDCVIFSLVMMTMGSRVHLQRTARDLLRVKRKTGKLLVAVTHPCFRQYRYSTFHTEYSEGKTFQYFLEGEQFTVTMRDLKTKKQLSIDDYHWSLSTTINFFLQSGFFLKEIFELPDYISKLSIDSNPNFPPYLILVFS